MLKRVTRYLCFDYSQHKKQASNFCFSMSSQGTFRNKNSSDFKFAKHAWSSEQKLVQGSFFLVGGTRHILRDFQEQLQSLRGQIGILTSQNTELKRRCSEAESSALDTSFSRTDLEAELNDCKAQLLAVQVGLVFRRVFSSLECSTPHSVGNSSMRIVSAKILPPAQSSKFRAKDPKV